MLADIDRFLRERIPIIPELRLRPAVLVAPTVGDVLRPETRAQLPMSGERALKTEIFVVKQQQFILWWQLHVSGWCGNVPAGTVIDFFNCLRIEETRLAQPPPRGALGPRFAEHLARAGKLFGDHLVAECRNERRPQGFIPGQQRQEIGMVQMLIDIRYDDPVRHSAAGFPTFVGEGLV